MNLNKIAEEWIGEDEYVNQNMSGIEYAIKQSRNFTRQEMRQRIPQLTERILEEIKKVSEFADSGDTLKTRIIKSLTK